ncbi:MAG: hypothetical protein ACNA7Y_00145 [Gammaproteobacteria bacterium]
MKTTNERAAELLRKFSSDKINDYSLIASLSRKLERLDKLQEKLDTDCEVRRTAGKIYSSLSKTDAEIFNILIDDADFFKTQKDLSFSSRILVCEKALLLGAKNICTLLMDEDINPKKRTTFISHAMCSGDREWVFNLIDTWKIDVLDPRYGFIFYIAKLGDKELHEYFLERKKNSENQVTENQGGNITPFWSNEEKSTEQLLMNHLRSDPILFKKLEAFPEALEKCAQNFREKEQIKNQKNTSIKKVF